MIALLHGVVAETKGDSMILDVGGVGYELTVTKRVSERFSESGTRCKLLVYTDVRENAILLFGFDSQLEREVFLLLRKVKGIGSKVALSIVSAMPPDELLASIGQGDSALLQRIPGVGKKLAERLVVELREQVAEFAQAVSPRTSRIERTNLNPRLSGLSPEQAAVASDAILALEKLGFPSERAREAVLKTITKASKEMLTADAGELTKRALSNL